MLCWCEEKPYTFSVRSIVSRKWFSFSFFINTSNNKIEIVMSRSHTETFATTLIQSAHSCDFIGGKVTSTVNTTLLRQTTFMIEQNVKLQ